jgi:hypothetical protein
LNPRLSEREEFVDSLILRSEDTTKPNYSDACEIAVKLCGSTVQFWQWTGEDSGLSLEIAGDNPSAEEIVTAVLRSDNVFASIEPRRITILRDRPPLGELLTLAWSDKDRHRTAAWALLKLRPESLSQLQKQHSICDSEIIDVCNEMSQDLDDMSEGLFLDDVSISGLRWAFRRAVAVNRFDGIERARRLAPYEAEIGKLIAKWAKDKPRQRYPSAGHLPPQGVAQLSRYLEEFVVEHQALPTGTHTIPAGPDVMDSRGQAFSVDFDQLRGEC